MTDRELLELAAKAAGYDDDCIYPGYDGGLTLFEVDHDQCGDGTHWNPLDDDGDALRLAVKLEIAINPFAGKTVVSHEDSKRLGYEKWDCHDEDQYAATRRAIVRAAAEIGKGNDRD